MERERATDHPFSRSMLQPLGHVPVLLQESVTVLDPKPGEFLIDGTLGAGGHARTIMEKIGPNGILLGVDLDADASSLRGSPDASSRDDRGNPAKTSRLLRFARNDGTNVIVMQANYADLPEILKEQHVGKADGLLLDLGFSSDQLQGKGFSFDRDEPLRMTYSDTAKPLSEVLRSLREEELERIIRDYGEERYARRIARAIYGAERRKPIATTRELREIVVRAVPAGYAHSRIHPATRTFQALRIFINDELGNLSRLLASVQDILTSGGRIAIISFHSLEDRIVKNAFRDFAKQGILQILTKKPITPSPEEIKDNPRSRSAKLRAARMN